MMEILIAVLRRAEIPSANASTIRLELKPIAEITKADVEAVRVWRRAELSAGKARTGAKGGEAGINRLLARLRHHLRAVLVAALSTGCRIGEVLSLQWSQIRRDEQDEARWIVLPAAKTKTAENRVIPVGDRLRAELPMRQHAQDGKQHRPSAYVFGTETGEQVKSIRRQWEDAVLRANGLAPLRVRGKPKAESRAALRAIGLHVHDLRREFASRLLESSADLHDVQMFLGHANITTTSRYLQSTPTRLERALRRLEASDGDAGFTHHSHTETSATSSTTSNAEGQKPVNSLK